MKKDLMKQIVQAIKSTKHRSTGGMLYYHVTPEKLEVIKTIMKEPTINCTKCKKGKCTFWRHVKKCLLLTGKYCGAHQHYMTSSIPLKRESRPNRIKRLPEEVEEWNRKMKEVVPITTKLEMDHLLLKEKDKLEILLEAIAGEIELCEEPIEESYETVIQSIKALIEQYRREATL